MGVGCLITYLRYRDLTKKTVTEFFSSRYGLNIVFGSLNLELCVEL